MAQRKSKIMLKKLRGMMLKKVAELVEEFILETFAYLAHGVMSLRWTP